MNQFKQVTAWDLTASIFFMLCLGHAYTEHKSYIITVLMIIVGEDYRFTQRRIQTPILKTTQFGVKSQKC